ncbi:MAG: hypothetical protein IJZ90_00520, partial [Clostridia bacterium]|nr:hypothetical protein [Clostridia bacterium]
DIGRSHLGFAVVCEIRNEDYSYGKSFLYNLEGKFMYSIDLRYDESCVQQAGTEYSISCNVDSDYYTAIDTSNTVLLDGSGTYLTHIEQTNDITVNTSAVSHGTLYIAGSMENEEQVPFAFMQAYDTTENTLLWTQKYLPIDGEDVSLLYSQIDDIYVLSNDSNTDSLIAVGKHFNTEEYQKAVESSADANLNADELNDSAEAEDNTDLSDKADDISTYSIDTIAKKSLSEDRPLYLTAAVKSDYITTPISDNIVIKADSAGHIETFKTYGLGQNMTVASTNVSTSCTADSSDFFIGLAETASADKTDTKLSFTLSVLDGNLSEVYKKEFKTDVNNRTYLIPSAGGGMFAYNSLNTTNKYRTIYFDKLTDYDAYISNLDKANETILFCRDFVAKLPLIVMFTIIYVLARIRAIIWKKRKKEEMIELYCRLYERSL